MTAWAAKIDQLSHERDVLFIQSAGNIARNAGIPTNPGLEAHLTAGRSHPEHLLEDSSRIANPGQALHALTVGSVTAEILNEQDACSFAQQPHAPSGFSRTGYGQPWSIVKPEVVEIGGDLVHSPVPPYNPRIDGRVAVELLNSTLSRAPAYSRDGVGTSFAAPKVAHIAAHLQHLFPNASPLLYRALIVQSARWPAWAENEPDADKILRLIGYGVPSVERAANNTAHRITYITNDAVEIPGKQYHLYVVRIPEELRSPAQEARIRIDVTLAYTAMPRRTRARQRG
jgi:subtilisin family serine protease